MLMVIMINNNKDKKRKIYKTENSLFKQDQLFLSFKVFKGFKCYQYC